jgi:ankyrin repeat protein
VWFAGVGKLLISAGAYPNTATGKKANLLDLAARYGRIEVVEVLMNRGAEIDFQDDAGYTPLHHAAWNNEKAIVELLIGRNANHLILNNEELKAFEIAPDPLKYELIECVITQLLSPTRSTGDPRLTPGMCVFCQAEPPVVAFRPCPHVELCDKCYVAHKAVLRSCPICKKFLKRVTVLNPVPEPEPIEEDPPEEEEKPEPPPPPPPPEEEEEDTGSQAESHKEEPEEADAESVATYATSGSTEYTVSDLYEQDYPFKPTRTESKDFRYFHVNELNSKDESIVDRGG